jgi:hypothetical protein
MAVFSRMEFKVSAEADKPARLTKANKFLIPRKTAEKRMAGLR